MAVNIFSVSKQWLISDKPRGRLYSESRDVLTATKPPGSPLFLRSVARDWLIQDKTRVQLYAESIEYLTATGKPADPSRLYKQYKQILYRGVDLAVYQLSKDVLKVLDRVPSIVGVYPQLRMGVTSALPVKPMAEVISTETVKQAVSLVTAKGDPGGFPWSITRYAAARSLVVQALPNKVISTERVGQTVSLVTGHALYTQTSDVVSRESVAQNVMMVCQSIDIAYQPTSGEYLAQSRVLVTQQADYPISYRSAVTASQQVMKVAQKRNAERLPQSDTRVAAVTSQAVTRRPAEGLPLSNMDVAAVVSQLVTSTTMDVVYGVQMTAQVRQLAVQATSMPVPLGLQRTAQTRLKVAQALPMTLPISQERVRQLVTTVLQGADYDKPSDMLAAMRAKTVSMFAVQHADYPAAEIRSFTVYAQTALAYTAAADASAYPKPEDIYAASKYSFVGSVFELATQRMLLGLPISYTRVPQMVTKVAQYLKMPTLEELANTGSFVSQVVQRVGIKADYPSTAIPSSHMEVRQTLEQVAIVADYPSTSVPVDAIVQQVSESAVLLSEYPDPASLSAPVNVLHVSEQTAVESVYPAAGELHAPVVLFQLATHSVINTSYPDKNAILSYAVVAQTSQQAAFKATYPGKDVPQSTLKVNQVRHQVARRDLTMYQMPTPPRRHRVRVVCRIVY